MLLLRAERIKKIYGDRIVLDIEELSVYTGDRIGVVGANGAGKTTLFQLLAGELEPEEGRTERYGAVAYCRQFENDSLQMTEKEKDASQETGKEISVWQVPERMNTDEISGGELMRRKLAEAFAGEGHVLLLDEPTANLDSQGIRTLLNQLKNVETFLCISHDRVLLDEACTSILEVAGGKVKMYPGNYQEYERQKEEERQKAQRDYEAYTQEKERLEVVYRQKRESAERMRKIPANMSPREARLRDFLASTGRNSSGKQKSMDRAADNVKKRLEHMEVKEKPRKEISMRLDFKRTDPPESRRVLEVKGLDFSYGERVLFEKVSFSLTNRKKTALLGPNGSGKTTLLSLLEEAGRDERSEIRLAPKVRLGVLAQNLKQLNPDKTVLENAMTESVQLPAVAKNVLAGLLFGPDDWQKKAAVLSGGERIKLGFAMLLLSRANVLLLDEPTNYLDLPSIKALEKQLIQYEGTVLFVSHDRAFVQNAAQEILQIENREIIKFTGTLEEWELEQKRRRDAETLGSTADGGRRADSRKNVRKGEEARMLLELQLARLTGQLGHAPSLQEKERLEAEYWEIVEKLRDLKG